MRMSINVYFVKLAEQTGVLPIADMAHRLGIDSIPNNLHGNEASLAIGAYEVTPLEMANAYSAFIGRGVICNPVTIIGAIRRDTGKPVTTPDTDCHQALNPAVANLIADILRAPLTAGGTLAAIGPIPNHDTGAKTGTTDNSAAVWTVGITAQYSTAVWVGDPNGGQAHPVRNIRVNGRTVYSAVGATVAGPIWKDTMVRATDGLPNGAFPAADINATGTVTQQRTKATTPDVRGLGVSEAVTILLRAGIHPQLAKKTAADDGITPADIVISQTPTAGTTVTTDPTVTLTLSHGSDTNVHLPSK